MALLDVVGSPTYVLTGVLVPLAVLWWFKSSSKKYKLPPGPTPLPIIGNIIELSRHPFTYKYFAGEMRKKYGDVFTVQLGSFQSIIVNNIESAREVLIHKQNDYGGRPHFYSADLFTDGSIDIVFSSMSPVWKIQRKIAHGAIRKYMNGKQLERRIKESVNIITEAFLKQKDPFDPLDHLTLMIYNILANMTFGKQWNFEDPEFKKLANAIDESNELFGNGLAPDYIPFLKYFPKTNTEKKCIASIDRFMDQMHKYYKDHQVSYEPGEESDLMYHLIGMKKEAEEEGDEHISHLTDKHMFQIVNDMFSAGTDTSRYTLHWTLAYLTAYPEIQEKVFAEIKEVCGSEEVSMEVRHDLPYTDAVLHEVMRLAPVAPICVPHTAMCDTTLGEYEIPKGTWVLINIWGMHHDPEAWDDPESLKPERFLGEGGKMAPKPPNFLPFSAGKRVCVGEALAKTEFLLCLALLCQRFKFEAPDGEKVVPECIPNALLCMAKPYRIIVKPR